MTRKEMQIKENEHVLDVIDHCDKELKTDYIDIGQLRSCSARVYETDTYYVLKSYRTIIACIDKTDNTLYDFLRYVYGYTATSAQHITKFRNDYGSHYAHTYTYRYV